MSMMKYQCDICKKYFSPVVMSKHITEFHNMNYENYLRNLHYGKLVGKCNNNKCNNNTKFTWLKNGFLKYCSKECQDQHHSIRQKELHNTKDNSYYDTVLKKQKKTLLEKYGNPHYNNLEQVKKTNLERYGVENVFELEEFSKSDDSKKYDKIRDTFLKKHGVSWVSNMKHVKLNNKQKNYGINKRIQTCNKKYNVDHYVQSDIYKSRSKDICKKIYETKMRNGTINSSKEEDEIYEILTSKYGEVFRNHKSIEYPFSCDFYIVSLDLYIEYQGYFTHGLKSFNKNHKNDKQKLQEWTEKSKTSDFYKNAIRVWTYSDVKKRKIAKENALNFLEIFSFTSKDDIYRQIDRVNNGVFINRTKQELLHEYEYIKKTPGSLKRNPVHNKIVLNFNYHFYAAENVIYKNDCIKRRKLIENRIFYLNKKEHILSERELLSGFKISGIHKGYSFFSPLWMKYFIEKYNPKIIYDPCGGWGHRLIGSVACNKGYIYNDLSEKTYNSVKEIEKFLSSNFTFHNNDCTKFTPEEKYDCVFTCPPYDNIEIYDGVKEIVDFKLFLEKMIFCSVKPTSCKMFAIIIQEKYEDILNSILKTKYISKEIVNNNKTHFKNKANFEFLYVYKINRES